MRGQLTHCSNFNCSPSGLAGDFLSPTVSQASFFRPDTSPYDIVLSSQKACFSRRVQHVATSACIVTFHLSPRLAFSVFMVATTIRAQSTPPDDPQIIFDVQTRSDVDENLLAIRFLNSIYAKLARPQAGSLKHLVVVCFDSPHCNHHESAAHDRSRPSRELGGPHHLYLPDGCLSQKMLLEVGIDPEATCLAATPADIQWNARISNLRANDSTVSTRKKKLLTI
jgi:hypothetical protein